MNRKDERLSFLTLETMAPLLMLNSFAITLWLTRKQGLLNMTAKSVGKNPKFKMIKIWGVCAFTYLAVTFYGEERAFYQNCVRDDVVGYFLRERYK